MLLQLITDGNKLKKSLIVIFLLGLILLATCSSTNILPADAEKALEAYWQSFPSYPNITYRILDVWPGVAPEEAIASWSQNMEIWCVEAEVIASGDNSVTGESLIWIVVQDDQDTDWTVAMLATMSSYWPYEACGTTLVKE